MFFFLNCSLTKCLILFGSRAHVNFFVEKQGRIAGKPVNAKPFFKVNQNITSAIQFFLSFPLCYVLSI